MLKQQAGLHPAGGHVLSPIEEEQKRFLDDAVDIGPPESRPEDALLGYEDDEGVGPHDVYGSGFKRYRRGSLPYYRHRIRYLDRLIYFVLVVVPLAIVSAFVFRKADFAIGPSLGTLSEMLLPGLRRDTWEWVARLDPKEGVGRAWFPAPFEQHRWTFFHATVRTQNDTYRQTGADARFLEILAFIEDVGNIVKRPAWQIIVADTPIESVSCIYKASDGVTWAGEGSFRRDFPENRYQLLLFCPLPAWMPTYPTSGAADVEATVSLAIRDAPTFSYPVSLTRTRVAPPSQVAICVPPVYGSVDLYRLLEWRLHHWLLGVRTVHWYDRTEGKVLEDWTRRFNKVTGAKDTWGAAPAISPETYLTDLLEASGKSGDQVLYYSDCQRRARTTYPSTWLSFTDLDEYFLPEPVPDRSGSQLVSIGAASAFSTFFDDAAADEDVGSLCIGRTQPFGPEVPLSSASKADNEHPLALAKISHERPPFVWDDADNYKCMHRATLELGFVHYPLSHYPHPAGPGIAFRTARVQGEQTGPSMRLLHMSNDYPEDDHVKPYPVNDGLVQYLEELDTTRRRTMDDMDSLRDLRIRV